MPGISQRSIVHQAREIMDFLDAEEAEIYLDNNCTDTERERIVSAMWDEWHMRCATVPQKDTKGIFKKIGVVIRHLLFKTEKKYIWGMYGD
ncbi:MAG: hypothetical protein E7667_03615 [Ruminococcaceae bacterium]|nr:hypothetical protein [Oscillospiraceae bacterium]